MAAKAERAPARAHDSAAMWRGSTPAKVAASPLAAAPRTASPYLLRCRNRYSPPTTTGDSHSRAVADCDTNTVSSNWGNPGGWGKLPPPRPPLANDSASSSSAWPAPSVATIDRTLGAPASLPASMASMPAASRPAAASAPAKPSQ